jgi:hypothetical protein
VVELAWPLVVLSVALCTLGSATYWVRRLTLSAQAGDILARRADGLAERMASAEADIAQSRQVDAVEELAMLRKRVEKLEMGKALGRVG